MQVDLLIVGQGLCGSWLSQECLQSGLTCCVFDQIQPNSPSRVSAGLINPITGRRHVEAWLADELLPFAETSYQTLGHRFEKQLIRKMSLIDFFPSEQMRTSFQERIRQAGKYVFDSSMEASDQLPFHQPFGSGTIDPIYLIDLPAFLEGTRNLLMDVRSLREEKFELTSLQIDDSVVRYKDIEAKSIVFCDGVSDLSTSFFPNLPYAPNKGEVLILDIPGLPTDHLYKQGMMLAPLSNGYWWCGSSYQWSFDDPHPTASFQEKTEQALQQWLKIPYTVIDHVASVRPATLERRPFVGFHPRNRRVGIFNGMGTKGCSLAPYFAKQLIQHWLTSAPIHPEASIERFGF